MNRLNKIFSILLILLCVGCGEVRHKTHIKPLPNDHWMVSDGYKFFRRTGVAQRPFEQHNIIVTAVPYIDEKGAVGPIIPIIPEALGDSNEDTILIIVNIKPPPTDGSKINDAYIVESNKKILASTIEAEDSTRFFSRKFYFNYDEINSNSFEFIIPKFDSTIEEISLQFEIYGETSYKILPPKGLFQ